jgi:hypothetical protein
MFRKCGLISPSFLFPSWNQICAQLKCAQMRGLSTCSPALQRKQASQHLLLQFKMTQHKNSGLSRNQPRSVTQTHTGFRLSVAARRKTNFYTCIPDWISFHLQFAVEFHKPFHSSNHGESQIASYTNCILIKSRSLSNQSRTGELFEALQLYLPPSYPQPQGQLACLVWLQAWEEEEQGRSNSQSMQFA